MSGNIKKQISSALVNRFKDTINLPRLIHSSDFQWIKTKSGLPWMQLPISVPVHAIEGEIKNIQHLFVEHRDDYGDHRGWKSFCIHGKSYNSTREDSHYDNNIPHHFTKEAVDLMPSTVEYFKNNFPAESYDRVRVMMLEPGGYIGVHKDTDKNKLSPINIAINNPAECHFVFDQFGVVPYTPGGCFWLDVGNLHTVCNFSDTPRYHIIVHAKMNKQFEKIVVNEYNKLYNQQI